MSQTAHVNSLDALRDWKNALILFEEEARDALCQVELEIRRFVEWLGHDQSKFWQAEVRKREDAVNNAKADLNRARISATFGRTPDCTDQKIALKKAKLRLEEAENSLQAVRRWVPLVDKEVSEYRAPIQQLFTWLDSDLPGALSRLDRMVEALEAYLSPVQGSAGIPSMSRPLDAARGEPLENNTPPLDAARAATEAENPSAVTAQDSRAQPLAGGADLAGAGHLEGTGP